MKTDFKIGDRVIHTDGSIGHIEVIEKTSTLLFIDVRWVTPNNEPSCCVSTCDGNNLQKISDNVLPMPKSKEWWAEAREFQSVIENVINNMDL